MKTLKDILIRAAKTAAQAGLAVVVASGTGYLDESIWKAAGVAALAAFLSALHNALLNARK